MSLYQYISRYPSSNDPSTPELRCSCNNNCSNKLGKSGGFSGGCGGCSGECYPNYATLYDKSKMIPGVAYKNGVPYNCACNLVQAPYSMPYEAIQARQCQPPYQAAIHLISDKCKCKKHATYW